MDNGTIINRNGEQCQVYRLIDRNNTYAKYGIRQTPGYLQKQPCHLPEETGVQLLCDASYDIWCRDLDTDQTSTEQACDRTDQNGCSTSHTEIEGPTSGSGRGQNS